MVAAVVRVVKFQSVSSVRPAKALPDSSSMAVSAMVT
jgi:hypothetical protein